MISRRRVARPRVAVATFVAILNAALSGCGSVTPRMEEVTDRAEPDLDASGVLERNIKEQTYCELRRAVQAVTDDRNPSYVSALRKQRVAAALPDDWGVEMTLTLEVDENTALNPGVALNTPFPTSSSFFPGLPAVATPQTFSLGLGGTLSSTATRIDKFVSFYLIKDLRTDLGPSDRCSFDETGRPRPLLHEGSSLLLNKDGLRIGQWLHDALIVESDYKSEATDPAKKDDVLSFDTKFVVVTNGNLTPTWKLVRVSANQSGTPFFGVGRTRSHDLLLTFAPTESPKKKGGPRQFGVAASNANLASQIGTEFTNSLRSVANTR